VNNFTKKKKNFKKNFSNAIFFLFILYYYLSFLNWKKKTLQRRFAFSNNSPQIEHIAKKIQNTKEKKKHARGPQINQRRSPNIFDIKKVLVWPNIKLQ
jgi:predicted negative regulator of RcsB-dependent stress response